MRAHQRYFQLYGLAKRVVHRRLHQHCRDVSEQHRTTRNGQLAVVSKSLGHLQNDGQKSKVKDSIFLRRNNQNDGSNANSGSGALVAGRGGAHACGGPAAA